jgi:hypothetical protein
MENQYILAVVVNRENAKAKYVKAATSDRDRIERIRHYIEEFRIGNQGDGPRFGALFGPCESAKRTNAEAAWESPR